MRIYFSNVTKPRSVSIKNISVGQRHVLALDSSGKIWSWGSNTAGPLGNNKVIFFDIPMSLSGANKTFCSISTGSDQSFGIDKNGQIWGWGAGQNGALGNNSTTASVLTPVSICGAVKTFCKIFAGNYYAFGIDKNNTTWAWGANNGLLGNNSTISTLTPVSIGGAIKTFCYIACGLGRVHGLDKNGKLWTWGRNTSNGELGLNTFVTITCSTPVAISGTNKTFCKVIAGNATSGAIDQYGQIWCWGNNFYGSLGNNSTVSQATPVSVCGQKKTFCEIAANNISLYAIDKYGKIWSWGSNVYGELGTNNFTNQCTPVLISGINKTFCKINGTFGGGNFVAFAIDYRGNLWGWGRKDQGTMAQRNSYFRSPVSFLGNPKTFCQISGGQTNITALDKYGQIWGWGPNNDGGVGNNSSTEVFSPTKISGIAKTFCKIGQANSTSGSIAIDQYGQVWCWGNGASGLGNNTATNTSTPVAVCGIRKTFCQVSAAPSGTRLALDKYGQIWAWGFNTQGQIGDNTVIAKCTPVSVRGLRKTFCSIAGGVRVNLAIDQYGQIWGWGRNSSGMIGNNSGVNYCTPVSICGARKTFCKIGGSYFTSYAIDKNGMIWSWGAGSNGELGNNTATNFALTPVSIGGLNKTFCEISAGVQHAIALDKNGKVWAWGALANTLTQLRDSTNVCFLTPININVGNKTFCKIHSYFSVTLIDKNGIAWGWGQSSNFGTYPKSYFLSPVRISIF